MDAKTEIEKGASIILSYNFLYDVEVLKEGLNAKTITKNDLEYENLLNYVDRLYVKTKISYYKALDGKKLYLYDEKKKKSFKLDIEKIYILFFENNTAFLNIKLKYADSNLEDLYQINKHLTTFYTKANQVYVRVGDDNCNALSVPLEDFEKSLKRRENRDCLERFETDKKSFQESGSPYLQNQESRYKIVKKGGAVFVNTNFDDNITLRESLYKEFTESYSPINKRHGEKNDYPFSVDYDKSYNMASFPDRIGPVKEERRKISKQNEEPIWLQKRIDNLVAENKRDSAQTELCELRRERIKEYKRKLEASFLGVNEHYLYFENQQTLSALEKEKNKLRYVDYDTFITSLIIKYVKPNKGVLFYDNFNPVATNYVNSYITLTCDGDAIDREAANNFVSFEPLISSKIKKGGKIAKPDYFEIYQSQSDMFAIGNSHNMVHILDKKNKDMVTNKKEQHFYAYQLSQLQRSSILRIINSSVLNITDIAEKTSLRNRVNDSRKSYLMISESVEKYTKFLTNINFSIISNSSSVDNSYQFFRRCNEVDELTNQWGKVSVKLADSKKILEIILNENVSRLLIAGTVAIYFRDSIIEVGSYILRYFGLA